MEGDGVILSNLVEYRPWIRLVISGHYVWSSHDNFLAFLCATNTDLRSDRSEVLVSYLRQEVFNQKLYLTLAPTTRGKAGAPNAP